MNNGFGRNTAQKYTPGHLRQDRSESRSEKRQTDRGGCPEYSHEFRLSFTGNQGQTYGR